MSIKQVTIVGAGTLGAQIAWQTAFKGFHVTVYDLFYKSLVAAKELHKQYAELFVATRGASMQEVEQTLARLSYTTDLAEAVMNADLISESVPENIEIKKKFYRELAELAPEKTIFTTNTSTLLPSQFAEESGRPAKFLALHFANGIWDRNIGEVMGHARTDPDILKRVIEFTKEIGMIPIPIYKEQNGYIMNSLLFPLLYATLDLLVNAVSDYVSIDRTWMIGAGVPMGPCAIVDIIGMETIYNVNKLWGEEKSDPSALARASYIKENFVDKNKLGVTTGEGFYTYPNPDYEDANFLK